MSENSADEAISPVPNFTDLVLETQEKWRSAKKFPLKQFSQAIDVPEVVSKNIVNIVIDNFPSYIPEDVRENLRENHPNPIVAVGFLTDKRFGEMEPANFEFMGPSWLNEDDYTPWMDGVEVLNEMANDTLAQETLKNLGRKNKWFAPIVAIADFEAKTGAAYKKAMSKVEKIFGGKDKFENFRQNLILAMLTGDNTVINAQLGDLGYQDIDRFALEIGREAKYSIGLDWLTNKFEKKEVGSIFVNGSVNVLFPEIVNINLAPKTLSLFNLGVALFQISKLASISGDPSIGGIVLAGLAFNGFFAIYPAITSQHTLVHETCHYLSQNLSHLGLEKWEKQPA
jgi:hypothetical protein